jgi:hypothetical protein
MKLKPSIKRARSAIAVGGSLMLLLAGKVMAIAPPHVSDEQLASYPIVVVAKWERAPVTDHNQYSNGGQVCVNFESHTSLNILTVIKGDVGQGKHDLMLIYGITWNDDGTFINSGTSTEMLGDVDDVTKPCLWFLRKTRSWDTKIKDEMLTVGNYREVQPLELKDFFVALGGRSARTDVPKLLARDKPNLSRRVLRYICGDEWPWPYDNDWPYDKPVKRGNLLRDEASRVWSFFQSAAQEERPLAASVYAELAGKECIANIRTVLDDRNPELRGIAVGVLAHYRDVASLDRFARAVEGLDDGTIACQVVKQLSAWKDERVVPALISFLQNDAFAYQIGDDIGVPALKAKRALAEITGQEFPFDVGASQKAWQAAVLANDKAGRKRALGELAPGGETPLAAAAIGLPTKEMSEGLKKLYGSLEKGDVVISVRLRNVSSRPATILKYPSQVETTSPSGCSDYSLAAGKAVGKDRKVEFVTIQPREETVIEAVVGEDFLIANPTVRRLRFCYRENGHRQNVKAWIGSIDVEFGSDWKYKRELKKVEEFWKNGNLKATGTTVNGVAFGEWNYFNEQGDRVRVEYPGSGRGTAICNPEHPENKGAGKRH